MSATVKPISASVCNIYRERSSVYLFEQLSPSDLSCSSRTESYQIARD